MPQTAHCCLNVAKLVTEMAAAVTAEAAASSLLLLLLLAADMAQDGLLLQTPAVQFQI
jgi:hypothetical protein